MPVRFTTPSLGGQSGQDVGSGEWQLGVAYRRLTADQWFVGSEARPDKAPFAKPLKLTINSLDLTVRYGVSSRVSLALTLPFSYGVQERYYADGRSHRVSAGGLGDASLIANVWARDPAGNYTSNVAFGLGVKTPSGNNNVRDSFFTTTGVTRAPVDQSIQLGDGGWGVIMQSQGYASLGHGLLVYAAGWYLLSPKTKTDVQFPKGDGTGSGIFLSVPDVYSARAGIARTISTKLGVQGLLGVRMDGIPSRDIVGGGDDGFRRPGYSLFADPGVSLPLGRGTLTVNVPLRIGLQFNPDITPGHPVGGDLAKVLLFVSYTLKL